MEYESDILKRLIKTYGVVGNPRYISEIIKEFIVMGKERFPELFTYQADWLAHIDEFGLNPSYTVSYTGQSIYAPNTLERPVKSAILTGQTLVNIANKNLQNKEITATNGGTSTNYAIFLEGKDYELAYPLIANKEYLIIEEWNIKSSNNIFHIAQPKFIYEDDTDGYLGNGGDLTTLGVHKLARKFIPKKNVKTFIFGITNKAGNTASLALNYAMIIEYQDGMENWGIPYFEGMQSVKMPVLTTTGKNLTSLEDCYDNFIKTVSGSSNTTFEDGVLTLKWNGAVRTATLVNNVFKPNTQYTLSYWCKTHVGSNWQRSMIRIKYTDGTESCLSSNSTSSTDFTRQILVSEPNKTVESVYVDLNSTLYINQIQLEESTTSTAYEPYKSNILTVNEPVELRGIGDVQDTLDCLTGELTERIGEIVFDGSEDWKLHETNGYFWLTTRQELNAVNDKLISDKLISDGGNLNFPQIYVFNGIDTVDKFKAWLQENKPTMQFKLEVESIKTVDLTILDQNGQIVEQLMSFNGGTHFNTGSLEGSLLPSVSVSVETDLEETLKVCSLEGNTL